MGNIKKLVFFTAAVAFILGILAVGNLDYTISKALIDRTSLFGEVFNLFGELPASLGLLIGTAILFGTRRKDVKWRSVLSGIIGLVFMAMFAYLASFGTLRYLYEFSETGMPGSIKALSLVIALLLVVVAIVGVNKIGEERLIRFRTHAMVLIALVVTEMILVNVLKIIWARPRMRSIESIEQFKYWYQINGPMNSEEFKSFPSGHTANGFVMLAYTMFIAAANKRWTTWAIAGATVWGVMVALSRVIMGAHFLSDVVVGGYVTILLFYVLRILVLKKKEV